MSFGKDGRYLDAIPVYGGTTTQRAASAGRRRKRNYGSRRPYWVDTFKPSETQVSHVRLIPGEYEVARVNERDQVIIEKLQWYEFVEHYSGTHRRGAICSGGPWFFRKDRREPCHGCDIRDGETKNHRTMSRSDKYVFPVIDMALFHLVQQVDRQTGQVRLNQKNEPYTEWVKCIGRGCQNCNVAMQSRYGHMQPWIMSKSHFNALNAYAPGIGSCCVTCRGRGTIQPMSWHCGNPQCHAMIFDMNTTTFTDEQIAEVVNDPFTCQACQQTTYPNEVITCSNCTPNNWQPIRATIFDVDLQVKAPRTGDNDSTVLQVVGMSDPKPLDPQFEDLLQYKPDLSKRFSPDNLEKQAEIWQVSGPSQTRPGQYSQNQTPPPAAYAAPYASPYGSGSMQQPVQNPQAMPPTPPAPTAQPAYQPPQQPPQQPQYQPQFNPMPQQPLQNPGVPNPAVAPPIQPPTVPAVGYPPPHGGYLPPQGGQQ